MANESEKPKPADSTGRQERGGYGGGGFGRGVRENVDRGGYGRGYSGGHSTPPKSGPGYERDR